MTQPGCTKMAISQLLLRVARSNLVGRKLKWYFIIKFTYSEILYFLSYNYTMRFIGYDSIQIR